jgi:hypothetical protein
MNTKQRLFCSYYCLLGNSREAASRAGISNPRAAERLLLREDIQNEIASLQKKARNKSSAIAGLSRLAFGSIADAVSLLDNKERSVEELENMDLFQISEIKCPKSGGMEIKFYDRLKALSALLSYDSEKSDGALPFYEALEKSAMTLGGEAGEP